MRVALSIEILAASLAVATAFSPSFVVHKNGAAMSRMTSARGRLDGGALAGRRSRGGAPSTRLDMMFDQLSSALTEVAQNFGGKQR